MDRTRAETVIAEKAALRDRMKAWRRSQDAELRPLHSAAICARVRALPLWTPTPVCWLFHAMPTEVDVAALTPLGTPCWPVVVGRGLPLLLRGAGPVLRGPFGIRQPSPECPEVDRHNVDVVIVPGLAFDPGGGRLGMGAGFYDRTLANMTAIRVGVCFEGQLVDRVPTTDHDLNMHWMVTERRTIHVAQQVMQPTDRSTPHGSQ